MTKEAFISFFKSVPKAELHLHLEAVISRGTIRRFYMRRHPELNEAQADEEIQKKLFSYYDLDGFIKSFIAIQNLYESPADFDYVFADLRDYLVRNGVVYAEVFVAPSAFLKNGFDFAEMVEVFHRNILRTKEETGITVRLLIDVSRTFGTETAEKNLQLLLAYRIPEIIGIGLGGSEQKGPANLFGGVKLVAEGANMPTRADAIAELQKAGVLFAPGKASNAGGVAVSGLEMSQNSERLSWTREEVDAKLKQIMTNIHDNAYETAAKYATKADYVSGANIYGFLKVARAMMAQGLV